MSFICRLIAVGFFLIAVYGGLQDIRIYLNEGRYIGVTVESIWKTHAADSYYGFHGHFMPDIPAIRLLITDALQQPAWVVFLALSLVVFLLCGRRRKRHSMTGGH